MEQKLEALPSELLDLIFSYLPNESKHMLNKQNYKATFMAMERKQQKINTYPMDYLTNVIKRDHWFTFDNYLHQSPLYACFFEEIPDENDISIEESHKKYIQIADILSDIIMLIMNNDSNECQKVLNLCNGNRLYTFINTKQNINNEDTYDYEDDWY